MSEPTVQQLRYFVALAEEGHFGRAAARCFVSQPALSSQIRELERRLGGPLVERTPRGALLTDTGRECLAHARAVLEGLDALVESAGVVDGEVSGPLRLGVIPTMAPYVLPAVVAVLLTRLPQAQLHLQEHRTAELIERLRGGLLDLALFAGAPPDPTVHCEHLGDDPFLLAVAASADLPRRPRLTDPRLGPVLLLEEGHCLRDQAQAVCALAEAGTATVQATSLATLVQMVAAGRGVTLLPASAVAVEAREGSGVRVVALPAPAPHRPVLLGWRTTSPRARTYQDLARLLRPVIRR